VIELSLNRLHFDFEVGNGCLQSGRPVDEIFAAIYQSFIVEPDKHFLHCLGETGIKSESFARPVNGFAKDSHLFLDFSTRVLSPFPDFSHELLTSEFLPANAILGQLSLDDHLGGNSRVIVPGSQRTRSPDIRRQRASTSCRV
jgi:hypothetical protein